MNRILLFAVLLMFQLGFGQTWTGATNTDWNTPTNWNTGAVPISSGVVIIPNVTNKPTISVAGAVCASLTIDNALGTPNTLTINTPGTLVVSGSITISAPSVNNGLSVIDVVSGTLSGASITLSNTTGSSRDCRLTIGSGTVTVLGSVTMSGAVDENEILFSGAGTLNVGNTITGAGTFTRGTGTVNYYNGGAQTVGTYTYNNLTLSGSGAKTTTGVTVNGILSMEGTATASAAPTYGSAATLQYNTATSRTAGAEWITPFASAGGVIIAGTGAITMNNAKTFNTNIPLSISNGSTLNTGNNAINFGGNFTNNGGTFTAGSSAITLSGTANQNIAGFTTTGAVTMAKNTGGLATFTGNVNGSSLSINGSGGRLSLGTGLIHTFSGNWDRQQGALYGGTSTLRISGNVTGSGSSFSAETSTVEFNGGAQNLGSGAVNYYNLVLSGTNVTKTFGGITSSSGTWTINTGVKANLGTITTHGAKILYLHGVGPRLDSWGSTGSSAVNRDNTFFVSSSGIINVISAIDNNYASYDNSTGETGGGVVGENTGPLVLTAPNGFVFINTKFSSYGLPFGSYPNYTIGGCHATTSNVVTTSLLGKTTVTIPSGSNTFNGIFGDPCSGTIKTYALVATYALPICSGQSPGIITGSLPTGGNGTYAYKWEFTTSTDLVNGPWTLISGATAKDYTPGTLTTTTYYRRTVTSGIYSDATIVIVPVISAPTTPPAITGNCLNSTLSVPASSIPGTYVEWFFGSCNSGVIATGLTYNPTVAGTYFARYATNRCGSTTCGSITIGAPGSNPVSITVTDPAPICSEDLTASLSYTVTGSPTTYTLTWTPSGKLIDRVDRPLPSSGPIVIDIPWNTPTGSYTGTIKVNSGNCVSLSKTFTLQVGTSASIPTVTPSVCLANAIPNITHTTAGATGIGTATGLPAGVTATWALNTITISGTPTQSGTFNYSIPLTGSCSGTVNATGTIIVNPLPSAPSVNKVDASCTVSTGSITITAPTGMNYSINGSDYTNTDGIFTSVAAGTYQVTVRNASGCISPATQVDINPQQLKTWTGTTSTDWHTASNWSPIGVPSVSDCVVIPNVTNDPIVTSTAYANTLTVQTGGQLTFENNSSLVQDPSSTTNSNSGAITYKRISSPMKNFDYTYWSSPVTGQTAKNLSPNTLADKYFRFSGSSNDWVFDDGVMTPGVGFIIRVPKPGSPAPDNWSGSTYSQPVAFKGTPNNGNYSFAVGSNQLNLIGNPYPSALDADLFMTNLNNASIINGALYFWTHKTAISQSGSNYVYTADDYATYTLTGGVGTGVSTSPSGIAAPTRYIAAGQSFFVENAAPGSFQFTNAMRVAGNNSQFFKQANTKKNSNC